MGRLGTDVLALTCIMGGAAVGGVATVAALESRAEDERVEVKALEGCAMVMEAPEVEVRLRDGEVRVGPARAPRIHARHECSTLGERITVIRLDQREHRERIREARARAEEARQRAAEARSRAEEVRREAEGRRLEAELRRIDALRQRLESRDERDARLQEMLRALEFQQQAVEQRLEAQRRGNR